MVAAIFAQQGSKAQESKMLCWRPLTKFGIKSVFSFLLSYLQSLLESIAMISALQLGGETPYFFLSLGDTQNHSFPLFAIFLCLCWNVPQWGQSSDGLWTLNSILIQEQNDPCFCIGQLQMPRKGAWEETVTLFAIQLSTIRDFQLFKGSLPLSKNINISSEKISCSKQTFKYSLIKIARFILFVPSVNAIM